MILAQNSTNNNRISFMIQKDTTFYNKFVGSLTKKGNKIAAKHILDDSLIQVSRKIKCPISFLLRRIYSKLHCSIEIRKIKIRKNIHNVPFPLTSKRQNFLKIKWILDEIKKNNRKIKMSEKLSTEIINLLKNKKSKILLRKKYMHRDALANQSNLHYRW